MKLIYSLVFLLLVGCGGGGENDDHAPTATFISGSLNNVLIQFEESVPDSSAIAVKGGFGVRKSNLTDDIDGYYNYISNTCNKVVVNNCEVSYGTIYLGKTSNESARFAKADKSNMLNYYSFPTQTLTRIGVGHWSLGTENNKIIMAKDSSQNNIGFIQWDNSVFAGITVLAKRVAYFGNAVLHTSFYGRDSLGNLGAIKLPNDLDLNIPWIGMIQERTVNSNYLNGMVTNDGLVVVANTQTNYFAYASKR